MAILACSVLRRNPIAGSKLLTNIPTKTGIVITPVTARCLHGPPRENEHSDVPLYPPIPVHKDTTEKKVAATKNFMAKLGTVEEKQYYLNQPKYYGWYSYTLNQDFIPCDIKPFLQFATQTHIVEGLPEYYKSTNAEIEKILDQIAPNIENIILNHHLHSQREYEVLNDRVPMRETHATHWMGKEHILAARRSRTLVTSIHQAVLAQLLPRADHLMTASEDREARNEAFWFRGGIQPDKVMIQKRKGTQKMEKKARDKGYLNPHRHSVDRRRQVMSDDQIQAPYDRALQYMGSNLIQMRVRHPLAPIVDRDTDPLVTQSHVAPVTADPRVWGLKTGTRHGTNVPGVWPSVTNQHGLLLYTDRSNNWEHKAVYTPGAFHSDQMQRDMMVGKALLSCWGWLSAQSTHFGFSPMTELTYPLVTQAAVTDGRTWTYAAYQLNSVDLTSNSPDTETVCNNVMWVSERDARLYDGVERGKVTNFRPESLGPLVKMLLNEPKMRDHSLTPYLSEAKTVSNFHEPYQRNKLHSSHRHMYANRPRHMEKPQIYWWEKVNLVDHKGQKALQIGSRRRRWFQMYKVHHWGREQWHPEFMEYKERRPPYVPKAFRKEDFMKKKGLGRRYSRYNPKLSVPLEEHAAVYKLPKTKYEKPETEPGFFSH